MRIGALDYPGNAVLIVAGVPGAGKTTLLRRLFPDGGGVRLLDSDQARVWWRRFLGRVPYRYWRPIVHTTHYLRLLRALLGDGPVVVHECATRDWARRLITALSGRSGRETHLLLLDVDPRAALAGQHARQRTVRPHAFAAHVRNWARLLHEARDPAAAVHRDTASITIIDRTAASLLGAIRFGR